MRRESLVSLPLYNTGQERDGGGSYRSERKENAPICRGQGTQYKIAQGVWMNSSRVSWNIRKAHKGPACTVTCSDP